MKTQTGHEYTKSNVKFAKSVQQSDAITKLEAFADANRDTQGVFTIGDEKVRFHSCGLLRRVGLRLTDGLFAWQKHNVFMRLDVSSPCGILEICL